jgi:hypothetical protein
VSKKAQRAKLLRHMDTRLRGLERVYRDRPLRWRVSPLAAELLARTAFRDVKGQRVRQLGEYQQTVYGVPVVVDPLLTEKATRLEVAL